MYLLPPHEPQKPSATSATATNVSVATASPAHPQDSGTVAHAVATFTCRHCGRQYPVSDAQYPHARQPAMCKTCARERRLARRARATGSPPAGRGATTQGHRTKARNKRITVSLSDYCVVALSVLSVGSTPSAVVEEAIMRYLADQSQEVIQYVRYAHDHRLRK